MRRDATRALKAFTVSANVKARSTVKFVKTLRNYDVKISIITFRAKFFNSYMQIIFLHFCHFIFVCERENVRARAFNKLYKLPLCDN